MKLVDILLESEWQKLTPAEVEEYKDDIFGLIQKAYSYIGGHVNYKSPDDVTGSEGDNEYEVIDLNNDDEIDAVNVAKDGPAGRKFAAIGHDGTAAAKKAVLTHKIELLKKPGFYIEVSGKIKDILQHAGVPIVTSEKTIRKALAGKEIEMHDDGTYTRLLGGRAHVKTMMGTPY